MKDDKTKPAEQRDDHELTFESGYGAQDKVLKGDETLEDVAGVSEEEVRQDLESSQDEVDKSSED